MRAIISFAIAGLIAAARPAAAEPPAADEKTDKAPERQPPQEPRGGPAPGQAAPARTGLGLGSLAEMAASAAAVPAEKDAREGVAQARRLDLTPQRQLQSAATASDPRGSERTSGIALPGDADWRVQAAEVGAMAAIFGTLVAVCGNGRCVLPEVFGGGEDRLGPSPDLQVRREQVLPRAR